MFNELSNPHKRRQKALILGFICRPQTGYIHYSSTQVWIILLSVLLARNLRSFVKILQAKNKLTNEIDIKCITWGITNLRVLDGKADGCSQWFHSCLA